MFYIGVDLGKEHDHTAIVVMEKMARGGFAVRHAERVPLGTPYPDAVERVREIALGREVAGRCCLTVDATGVGTPVVDMLRAARMGCEICAVKITSGERETQAGQMWHVPKRDLIAGVQVLLQKGELRIARRLREAGALVRELLDVQIRVKSNGHARMGADGHGEHDDLAIALALGCWRGKRGTIGFGGGRLPGI